MHFETPPVYQYSAKLSDHKFSESQNNFFPTLSCNLVLITWSKDPVALRAGASHSNLAPNLVWCRCAFCKWRYLICHVTSQDHLKRIHGWQLHRLCHHPDQFCDYKHCDSEHMFLICHVTNVIKCFESYWISGCKPLTLSHHLVMV